MHVINGYHGRFPSFVIMSLARVWRQSWSPVKSLCRFCMSALGLVLFKHRPNENYTLFYAYCNTWKSKQILLLLTIVCLCHKGIHIPSLCAFYGNALRKILPNKRLCHRQAHTESAVNTPFVTEQMTESVHTTSLWPSWNGKFGKPLFIHKLAHACIQMCLENQLLFINSYMRIQVCVY